MSGFHMNIAIPAIDIPSLVATGRALPQPAADAPSRSFESGSLFVDLSCADSVTLLPQQGLGRQVIVSVTNGQEKALQALSMEGGTVAGAGCAKGESGDFILRLAPDKVLRIQQTGGFDIRGGRFTGPVTIEAAGSGTVTLDGTGGLTVRQRAAGDVFVGTVDGVVDAEMHGSGDLHIGEGAISSLNVSMAGSGDLTLGRAAIGPVHLVLNGSGDLVADRVSGAVDALTTGSGDISIASVTADTVHVAGEGSGDIVLRSGRIGNLTAERLGKGDLLVQATIAGGSVSHRGTGDVTLPHVTGPLTRTGSQEE